MTDEYPGMAGVEYCPVSIGAKLIGDRWSLLIVRELLAGATRFNAIHRGLPGLSRTLLASRLRGMVTHGIVEHRTDTASGSYHLTAAGSELADVLVAIGTWTVRWRFPPPEAGRRDSALLLWRLCQSLRPDALPTRRVIVELTFSDAKPARGWLIVDGRHSSMCMETPSTEPDVVITGSIEAWSAVRYGHRTFIESVKIGALRPSGPTELTSAIGSWFHRSEFADAMTRRGDRSGTTLGLADEFHRMLP